MNDFTGKPTSINWNGSGEVGWVEYDGGSRGQVALFYKRGVIDPQASAASGRQIFKDQTYIRVAPPGERFNIVDRPATTEDRRRWPVQWAQFQNNHEQIPEGTPIEQLYPERPAIAQTLRASGVHTIEQCSELSGNAIDSIGMGAQMWSNFAKEYIAKANKGVTITQHRKEMEHKDQQIKLLTKQVQDLSVELQVLRQNTAQAVNVAQVQEMISGMMGRPVMPRQTVSQQFDAQTQQINAVNRATRQRVKIK